MVGTGDSLCKGRWYSLMRIQNDVFSWFADIDECTAGLAKCKKESYCRNEIGSYYCSCFSSRIINWLAKFIKSDHEACYGKDFQIFSTMKKEWVGGRFWELLWFQVRVREKRSVLVLILYPTIVPGNVFPEGTTQAFSTNHWLYAAALQEYVSSLGLFPGLPKWYLGFSAGFPYLFLPLSL